MDCLIIRDATVINSIQLCVRRGYEETIIVNSVQLSSSIRHLELWILPLTLIGDSIHEGEHVYEKTQSPKKKTISSPIFFIESSQTNFKAECGELNQVSPSSANLHVGHFQFSFIFYKLVIIPGGTFLPR